MARRLAQRQQQGQVQIFFIKMTAPIAVPMTAKATHIMMMWLSFISEKTTET
jgi:hypothetical protein